MFITDSSHKLELPGSCSVFVEIPQWMCILESLQKCCKSVLQCSDWVLPWNLLVMYSCSLQVLHSLIAKLARFSLSSIFACNQGPRKMKLFSSFTVVKEELPKELHLYLYQRRTYISRLSAPSQVLLEDAWGQCTASAWCRSWSSEDLTALFNKQNLSFEGQEEESRSGENWTEIEMSSYQFYFLTLLPFAYRFLYFCIFAYFCCIKFSRDSPILRRYLLR